LPGEDGNLVITGHNYRNGAHFGKLDKLEVGDSVTLTDKEGKTYAYTVYKLEHIKPDNPEALDNTTYPRELTLLTCEARGNRRLIVRCVPVEE
jgi:LPXTG-site transpeptidase (sortase) family protein